MQMQNQFKLNNNKFKKSHILIVGSFLIFIGIISFCGDYLLRVRDEVYSDMKIAMMGDTSDSNSHDWEIKDAPVALNVNKEEIINNSYIEDYSKYFGVLEIPKIGLKRGFYNVGSKYNNVQYNVTMVDGSSMPDVINGNLILMAHSGDAYISYFAHLWRLDVGDSVYITYNGYKYQYQIVNIYEVTKNGLVTIHRNENKTTLTMITCTKDNDNTQSVYISELVG